MKKIIFFIIFFSLYIHPQAFPDTNIKYLSLKNNKVNVRMAPSKTSPIKWVYEKKNFPVAIVDEYYNWRKVKDFENDYGWVHISQLSRKRSVLFIEDETLVFKKPTIFSQPLYKLQKQNIGLIEKCSLDWCRIKNTDFKGWVKRKGLWGLNKDEIIK